MKRLSWRLAAFGGLIALVSTSGIPTAQGDAVAVIPGTPSVATSTNPNKIDVMGIWAHPDDDASFTTPCGVWHDKYGVSCGIVMLTRGEGGSNSVGAEAGPDLGLRRENEDRASHYRSGTVDIYNIDAVDFFYNTSAPLTEQLWGSERIQRQVVHVIRQTQPEILMGFSPSLAVGHGNHQYAGRVVWEAAAMAADPTKFPEQLTGPDAVSTWQVKQITSGGSTTGTGGTNGPQCNTGFTPAANNPFTVVGTWNGYNSPYTWYAGNTAGQPAGAPMTWAQVGREGAVVHATQARTKQSTVQAPSCNRYGISWSSVPFQPNGSAGNGQDNAILFGSVIADPGGMPLGSTFRIDAGAIQAPGEPFQVKITARSGSGTIPGGQVTLGLPAGWSVSGNNNLGPISATANTSVTLMVTPAADAAQTRFKMSASFNNGNVTAYNDTRVDIVPAVQGRYQRWGNFAEYETWADRFTWVGGFSNAVGQIGAGESKTVPVVVTNRSSAVQSGTVALTLPASLSADAASKTFSGLAAGASTTVNFIVTHTDPADLGGVTVNIPINTSTTSGISSTETLQMYIVPTTVIPNAAVAPVVDGNGNDAGYGPELNIARRWEGSNCSPDGVDCGAGSTLKLAWSGDALYAVAKVVDDKASAAAPPDRCFGHWLVDSVEFLLDPMSGSVDTSTTFKSGVFPFTDDASNYNGNGVNGPCWSRDADNHQGFSTGPLAATVKNAPNAPGQQVAVNVTRNADGTYAGGSYTVEVKIPLADLPAAVVTDTAPTGVQATNMVDPHYLGLNVTPYDSDVQTFIGKTRTAWSPFGSQQSEPYRWGHAYLAGYTAPAGSSTTATAAIIPDSALLSVDSPESIYQSATRGVTLSGQAASHGLTITNASIAGNTITLNVNATEAGTVHLFAWDGMAEMVQVWNTSCAGDTLGFSVCNLATDMSAAPWAPDMGGHVLGSIKQAVPTGSSTITLTLSAAAKAKLSTDSSLLVSYLSNSGGVDAWRYPMVAGPSATASFDSTTRQLTITASAAAPATIEYKLAGGSWVTYTGPVTVPNSITSVEYRVTDGAGNVSNVSTIDTPATGIPPASNVDVYSTPGTHFVNGRYWNTTCEPYSQTVRCRTDIWATQVTYQSGVFVPTTGWFFNNLTYLPLMTRAQWGANPLASTGEWTSAGRQWKTECDTAVTGRNGCRNYIWASYIAAHPGASGYTYTFEQGWVLNSIVRFKAV